jgi:hypothetical protein
LSLYQKAKRDSIKHNEAKRSDPYFKLPALKGSQDTVKRPKSGSGDINPSLGKRDPWIDKNEETVNQKLEELYKSLNASSEPERTPRYESNEPPMDETRFSNDVEELESMMQMMQADGAENKEMQEVQAVLDKILDIQHPERVEQRLRALRQADSAHVFGVSPSKGKGVGSIGRPAYSVHLPLVELNRFYGIDHVMR